MQNSKKHVALLFGIAFCWQIQGQNPFEIQWSKPMESDQDIVAGRILYADTSGILLFRQEIEESYLIGDNIHGSSGKKEPPIFEHYDTTLSRNFSFTLDGWSPLHKDKLLKDGQTEGHYDRWYFPYHANNKTWFAFSNYTSEDNMIVVKAQEMDIFKRKLSGTPIEIFRFKDTVEARFGPDQMREYLQLGMIGDRMSSKIMFYSFPQAHFTNRFNVKVFDRKMRPMWAKEFSIPFVPNNFEVKDFQLSATGKLYCLAKVYEGEIESSLGSYGFVAIDGTKTKREHAPYSTILLELSSDSDNANVYRLDMGKSKLIDATLFEDQDGQIHCAGLYSDGSNKHFYGCVDFVLNPFGQTVEKRGPLPFSPAFLKKVSVKREDEKKPYLEAFDLSGVHLEKNGRLIIAGSYSDSYGIYHSMVLNIDSSFQALDGIRIKKSQSVKWQSDWLFAGSIGALGFDNGSLFLFNDEIQGDNKINAFFWSGLREGESYVFPQPDKNKNLLLSTISHRNAVDSKIYFLAETRNHKTYRLGLFHRKR
jgi:hypothetical protein